VFIRLERHLGRLRASIKQQGEINAKVSEEMPPLVSDGRGGFTSDEHHRGIALIAKFSDGTLIIDTKSGRVCFECVVAENAMMEKNPLVEKPAG